MNGKINLLLSAFETQPTQPSQERRRASLVFEHSALNNRMIELYEGVTSEHRLTSIATQTKVQKPTKNASHNAQVSKGQVPKVLALKPHDW